MIDSEFPTSKKVLFVFGQHKHWTGMVWEWGLDTLGNSARALKKVLDETGLKAGLNFDGKGIEYLAVNDPEAIAILRALLDEGRLEIWGGTFTQPYGSLIGHESNIKQRQWGVRAFEKLLGRRPDIFAEEEFDFFPQLPQILNLLGYDKALLFPQHTWHTPTFPAVDEKAIYWRGIDGSRIKTVPYSHRCMMRGIPSFRSALEGVRDEEEPLLISWLEILDKPNWMWRSDFVIEHLKKMQESANVVPVLVSDYLDSLGDELPEREYSPDELFHGISVGKNGDELPLRWFHAEQRILRAEFQAAWCSFLGQPYPQFDSYPEWELDEAWRILLESQGHDAYECEGLTHHMGQSLAFRATAHARGVVYRSGKHLNKTLGEEGLRDPVIRKESNTVAEPWSIREDGLIDGPLLAEAFGVPTGWKLGRRERNFVELLGPHGITGSSHQGSRKDSEFVGVTFRIQNEENLEAGIMNSVMMPIRLKDEITRFRVDSPFAVHDVRPSGKWLHRQPEGDWLTSKQWEEWIPNPISHLSFICMDTAKGGMLYVSRQNQLALVHEKGIDIVMCGRDAWDQGGSFFGGGIVNFGLAQVGRLTNRQLLALAERALTSKFAMDKERFVRCHGPAFITAIRKAGEELEIRLFETEGEPGEAELTFLWDVESARAVDLLDNEMPFEHEIENTILSFPLKPRQILTLRILFIGKRTEYPDVDSHRDIWVG